MDEWYNQYRTQLHCLKGAQIMDIIIIIDKEAVSYINFIIICIIMMIATLVVEQEEGGDEEADDND